MSKVQLAPYDVLQVQSGAQWQDFATLRTAAEFDHAITVVDRGEWQGAKKTFRVVNMLKTIVKYPVPLAVGDPVLTPGEAQHMKITAITEVAGFPMALCEKQNGASASYPLHELKRADTK